MGMISLSEDLMDNVRLATYDGDTTKEERAYARSHANIIITNPGENLLCSLLLVFDQRKRKFMRLTIMDVIPTFGITLQTCCMFRYSPITRHGQIF